jgi:predicted translin family RNA/ssDNA-binding protein
MLIDVIAQLGLGAKDCLVSLSRLSVVVMAHLSGVYEVIGELWGSSCLH